MFKVLIPVAQNNSSDAPIEHLIGELAEVIGLSLLALNTQVIGAKPIQVQIASGSEK